jgi:hypothetical protein
MAEFVSYPTEEISERGIALWPDLHRPQSVLNRKLRPEHHALDDRESDVGESLAARFSSGPGTG